MKGELPGVPLVKVLADDRPRRARSKNYSSRGEKLMRSPGLSVAVPASMKRDLRGHAEARGVSVSRVVRDLIETELAGTRLVVPLGVDLMTEVVLASAELGTTPELVARTMIRRGLRGMRGVCDAY